MEKEKLPIVHLYKKVLFPFCNITFQSGLKIFMNIKPGDTLLAFPVRNILDILFPLRKIATLSEVVDASKKNGIITIQLKGLSRIRIKGVSRLVYGKYDPILKEEDEGNGKLQEELRKKSQELVFLINVDESDKLIHLLNFLVDLSQLTDFISNYFVLRFPKRFQLFRELNVVKRAKTLVSILDLMVDDIKKKRDKAEK